MGSINHHPSVRAMPAMYVLAVGLLAVAPPPLGSVRPCAAQPPQPLVLGVGNGLNDRSSNLFRIDDLATQPRLVDLGETGRRLGDIAYDPATDTIYAGDIDNGNLYRVHPSTAALTLIGQTGIVGLDALEAPPGGPLCAMSYQSRSLYEVDPATGAATVLITDTGYESAGDLALEADRRTLYLSTRDRKLVRLNLRTGAAVEVGPLAVDGLLGLDIAPDGRMYALQGTSNTPLIALYEVNKQTAAVQFVQDLSTGQIGAYGLTITPPVLAGDLNGDGCVDQADLGILLAAFGSDGRGDLDGDGDTDQADLGILLGAWNHGC